MVGYRALRDQKLPERHIDEVGQNGHIVNVNGTLARLDLAYPRLSEARFIVDCTLGKVGRFSRFAKVPSKNQPLG